MGGGVARVGAICSWAVSIPKAAGSQSSAKKGEICPFFVFLIVGGPNCILFVTRGTCPNPFFLSFCLVARFWRHAEIMFLQPENC